MCSQKIFSQVSLRMSTKDFQNGNYHVLSEIMIFWREVLYCTVLDAAIQMHREQRKSKWNNEVSVIKREIHTSMLELQRWSLEFDIPFSKVYICD
jgi:hypothetical protein